jgi:hypothetical protein
VRCDICDQVGSLRKRGGSSQVRLPANSSARRQTMLFISHVRFRTPSSEIQPLNVGKDTGEQGCRIFPTPCRAGGGGATVSEVEGIHRCCVTLRGIGVG